MHSGEEITNFILKMVLGVGFAFLDGDYGFLMGLSVSAKETDM